MTRRAVFLLALFIAASPVVAAPASEARARCGTGSWIAGTTDVCNGTLIYRDYIYDDHGAGRSPLQDATVGEYVVGEVSVARRAGNDGYGDIATTGVADEYGFPPRIRDNAADLVRLSLSVTGRSVRITAELNTVVKANAARVVVGIDTDDDRTTQASPTWPGGLVASPHPLVPQTLANVGLDTFVTLANGDPKTNTVSATVARPEGSTWRLQAVTATGVVGVDGPVVMNVAFRGPSERGGWWEHRQAIALAGNDISPFSHTVDVADLVGRRTRRAVVTAGTLRQRVYVSRFLPGSGEGVSHEGVPGPAGNTFSFLGRYQPYGFYVPKGKAPHELQLLLHGLGENHSVLVVRPGTHAQTPNIAARFAEPNNRMIAVPLARGPSGWYSSFAERDVLDVLADVKTDYRIDGRRIFLSGISMGGYGAMRLGSLYPDRFAAIVQWVGHVGEHFAGTPFEGSENTDPSNGLGNAVDLLGNMRNVPMAALYGAADQLVPVNQAMAVRNRLVELGIPSMWWLHTMEHSTIAVLDDWAKEAKWSAGRKRVVRPPRVSFRTDRRFFFDKLGISPNGAYWVSHIVPAAAGYADVDANSAGCGALLQTTNVRSSAGPDPVPWIGQEVAAASKRGRRSNAIELVLSNIASLRIDSAGACVNAGRLAYKVTSDRTATVTFSDGRRVRVKRGTHEGSVSP